NRAVFTESTVQNGENYIHVNRAIGTAPQVRIGLKRRESSIAPRRFWRNDHRLASSQHSRPRSRLRIAGPKLCSLCGADTLVRLLFLFALAQTLGMLRREPAAVFRDADGNNFIFRFINCVHNGRRRQQRHFMFAAASTKEDANPKLCHTISVWPPTGPPSIAGWVPDTASRRAVPD